MDFARIALPIGLILLVSIVAIALSKKRENEMIHKRKLLSQYRFRMNEAQELLSILTHHNAPPILLLSLIKRAKIHLQLIKRLSTEVNVNDEAMVLNEKQKELESLPQEKINPLIPDDANVLFKILKALARLQEILGLMMQKAQITQKSFQTQQQLIHLFRARMCAEVYTKLGMEAYTGEQYGSAKTHLEKAHEQWLACDINDSFIQEQLQKVTDVLSEIAAVSHSMLNHPENSTQMKKENEEADLLFEQKKRW